MRITIKTLTSPARVVVLGDDADKLAPISGWLPGWVKRTQTCLGIRARAARKYDRGNVETSFSFLAARNFTSAGAMLSFVREHLLDVPREGLVEVSQLGGPAGASLFLARAQVEECAVAELAGTHVVFRYRISGGELAGSMAG